MAEELADILGKFDLIDKEKMKSEVFLDEMQDGIKICELSLIGKIAGEKIANFNGVKNFVINSWGCPKNVCVSEIGLNLFQFEFKNRSYLDRILCGGPWVFDNQMLVLKQWRVGIEDDEEAFKVASFWVQIWNLPLHCYSKEIGMKVGSVFEKVKEVSIPQTGSKEGRYLKIWIDVDISQPLIRGTTMSFGGTSKWLQFRYERT